MRLIPVLLPALLLAQTPAPKPAAPKPAPAKKASAAVKPAAPKPAAAKAAAPKPAGAKPASAKVRASAMPSTNMPSTNDEKAVYALGLSIHRSLGQFDLSAAEMEILKQALTDAAEGKPAGELSEWGPMIDPLAKARAARVTEGQQAASKAYLDKAAGEPGAVRASSGLIYRELTAGTGASPKATDTVKVHYRGTLVNGTEFDSSYKRNEPAEFPLDRVIKCWTEGVQMMKVGGKATLVCPSDLAYGDQGRPTIPGGAALIFEIELLEIAAAAP
jgi:FKBP-type peptidyl-prolyl cis-trans isomerase FkpA